MIDFPGRVDCIFPGQAKYECGKLRRPTEADCAACTKPRPLPEVLEAWHLAETLTSQGVASSGLSAWAMDRFFPDVTEEVFLMAMRIFNMIVAKERTNENGRRSR